MDHIVQNLWLGSQQDADAVVHSNPEQITAILNVRGPDAYRPIGHDQSGEHPGKAYKWIPAPDTGLVSPQHVKDAVEWLEQQTAEHKRILIHCMFGISRAPAFLAAFMVKSGISTTLEDAHSTISLYRNVQPATQISEPERRVVLISALTGLPNRSAFDDDPPSPFVAILDIDLMAIFNNSYGRVAGDILLRRLAKILIGVGLEAFHIEGDEFACKGNSREELALKLAEARKLFQQSFQVYAGARIQTIEGTDFSYVISRWNNTTTWQSASCAEQRAMLRNAQKTKISRQSPEWFLKMVAETGNASAFR